MIKSNTRDWLIVGGAVAALLVLMILAKQTPVTNRNTGAQWCASKGLVLDKVAEGKTSRPPYHDGTFTAQTKLLISCKKRLQ